MSVLKRNRTEELRRPRFSRIACLWLDESMLLTMLICTRNGSATIAEALKAIFKQKGVDDGAYEVLVVDNGSTDGTIEIAKRAFAEARAPCRLEIARQEGKLKALLHGVRAARGELVSIIDDDNIVSDEFILHVIDLFKDVPRLGMAGSYNRLGTSPEPAWFRVAAGRYACADPFFEGRTLVLDEHRQIGESAAIAGAGMTFRRDILIAALDDGFDFMNDTFRGGKLSVTGEDIEQCLLFSQYGYWFGADRRIRLEHRINPSRLNWQYAKNLCRSIGAGGVAVDAQIAVREGAGETMRGTWWWIAARRLRRLARILPLVARAALLGRKFDRVWLVLYEQWGGLARALTERRSLTLRIRAMQGSRWLARAASQRRAFDALEGPMTAHGGVTRP